MEQGASPTGAAGVIDAKSFLQVSEPVLNALDDPLVVIDDSACYRFANTAFTDRFGYGRELVGTYPPFPFWPPEQRGRYGEMLRRLLRETAANRHSGPAVFDVRLRDSGGHERHSVVSVVNLPSCTPACMVTMVRDPGDPRSRLRTLERAMQGIATHVHHIDGGANRTTTVAEAGHLADRHGLSAQQRVVIELFAEHRPVSTIAGRMHLSPHTVRGHLKAIFRRLEVGSQRELRELLDRPEPPG